MAKNIANIACCLGAKAVAELPDTGGGAIGAARVARIVAELQARLAPESVRCRRRSRLPGVGRVLLTDARARGAAQRTRGGRPMIQTADEYQKAQDELRHLEDWLQGLHPVPEKGLTKAGLRKMIARLHEELAIYEGSRELHQPKEPQ